jgi:hypothetical protein
VGGALVALSALVAPAATAESVRAVTQRDDALVQTLEAVYTKSMEIAQTGDIDAYWRYRTRAARTRPPALDSTRIKLLAELLPPLAALDFVRVDATGRVARALYRWRGKDVARFTVIVFAVEEDAWKVDEITVKNDAAVRARGRSLAPKP